jgi:hypothetical protein
MEQYELFSLVYQGKKDFGVKCKKFSGALTIELFKHALENAGIIVSPRDIFIKGLDVEIDLAILKKGRRPKYETFFEPEDVLAALEIKAMGSFGENTITQTRDNFKLIHSINDNIYCAYVTLTERKGFKWAVTPENLGFPAYTLFWHKGNNVENAEPSGDYMSLVNKLQQICLPDKG